MNMIQRVVVLLIPGLTPEILALPPFPTSATSNPNLPISIPLLSPTPVRSEGDDETDLVSSAACIPFIASTFSHACPTRAPGDQTKMHSVLSSFFTGPVTIEEKKKRDVKREQCVFDCSLFFSLHDVLIILSLSAEINKSDPMQYLLTLDQMIENDYPIPSYMAEIFQKPSGWVETPKLAENESKWKQKIYAIDCEMVSIQTAPILEWMIWISFYCPALQV